MSVLNTTDVVLLWPIFDFVAGNISEVFNLEKDPHRVFGQHEWAL
jgi:hypothetical protein